MSGSFQYVDHSPVYLGGQANSFYLGDVAEILMYSRALSQAELLLAQGYLADKWGVYAPSATWPRNYSGAVQALIEANRWTKAQADAYQFPVLSIVSGPNQRAGAGQVLAQPVVIQVANYAGEPLAGFPLRLAVIQGNGAVAASRQGGYSGTLDLSTGSDGRAAAYLRLGPGGIGTVNRISCAAVMQPRCLVYFTALVGGSVNGTVDAGGGSGPTTDPDPVSSISNLPPQAPVLNSVDATDQSDPTQVTVSWDGSGSNAGGFVIQRRISSGEWDQINDVGANQSSVTDSGLKAGQRYEYRVIATANGQQSSPSNEQSYSMPVIKAISVQQKDVTKDDSGDYGDWSDTQPPREVAEYFEDCISDALRIDGRYKFKLNPLDSATTLKWSEIFVPSDGSASRVLHKREWTGNASETDTYEVDPSAPGFYYVVLNPQLDVRDVAEGANLDTGEKQNAGAVVLQGQSGAAYFSQDWAFQSGGTYTIDFSRYRVHGEKWSHGDLKWPNLRPH